MNFKTSKVAEQLKLLNISVISVEKSTEIDLEDDLIQLEKGFYITINESENYATLWQSASDSCQKFICDLPATYKYTTIIQNELN
jgi:hypothetical protein